MNQKPKEPEKKYGCNGENPCRHGVNLPEHSQPDKMTAQEIRIQEFHSQPAEKGFNSFVFNQKTLDTIEKGIAEKQKESWELLAEKWVDKKSKRLSVLIDLQALIKIILQSELDKKDKEARQSLITELEKEILGLKEEPDCAQNPDYPSDQCTPTCGNNNAINRVLKILKKHSEK